MESNMKISRSIVSFSGALGRSDFAARLIGAFLTAMVLSVLGGMLREPRELSSIENIIIFTVVGFAYITLVGMVVRRIRDIFGTPVFENLKAILLLVWSCLPGIGFIAWILLCVIPGAVTEQQAAERFKRNSSLTP